MLRASRCSLIPREADIASPFDFWLGLWSSGAKATQTGLRFTEMMAASSEVMHSRLGSIAHAMSDPLNGDYRELGRMVPEKVEAFSRAGASMMGDVGALQANMLAAWTHGAAVMLSGRPSTLADAATAWTRSGDMFERSIGMSGKAMAPIHKQATANARRLRAKRTKA
ncbi:hypothetical protein [Sphingomonas crusticola]|uniref:hypothetical protein n=1 Tax=Sphingomonas crusticola TaxID=1697973 RepID=UPI000E254593|nr:hypothetical protein [Sphingomonas crusticola]